MRDLALLAALTSMLAMVACGPKPVTLDDYHSTPITLPDGTKIMAETMRRPEDMMRGMMFRDSLAPDRGMLFVHGEPGPYAYWMYQVRIPLDILWLDQQRRIVEISPNTPPCKSSSARECPSYGGREKALFVLELNAGMVEKHKLRVGDQLKF